MAKDNNAKIADCPRSAVCRPACPLHWPVAGLCAFCILLFYCVAAGKVAESRRFFVTRIRRPSKLAEARRAVINSITFTARAATLLHPTNNCRRAALFADGCRSLLNKTHNKHRVAVFYLLLLPLPLPLLLYQRLLLQLHCVLSRVMDATGSARSLDSFAETTKKK